MWSSKTNRVKETFLLGRRAFNLKPHRKRWTSLVRTLSNFQNLTSTSPRVNPDAAPGGVAPPCVAENPSTREFFAPHPSRNVSGREIIPRRPSAGSAPHLSAPRFMRWGSKACLSSGRSLVVGSVPIW